MKLTENLICCTFHRSDEKSPNTTLNNLIFTNRHLSKVCNITISYIFTE